MPALTDFFSWFGEEGGIDCYLNSTTLGYYYTIIDLGLCIIVLFAYLWLKYFEETESKRLDRNTVFASMYTIVFKHLPPECTEESIQQYVEASMEEAGFSYKVAAVNVAFDNHTGMLLFLSHRHLPRYLLYVNAMTLLTSLSLITLITVSLYRN